MKYFITLYGKNHYLLLPLVSQKKSLGIGKLAYNGGIKAQILSQGKNT